MAASEVNLAVVDGGAGAAMARGKWTEALDALRSLTAQWRLTPVELDMLARAAFGPGELELAIGAWESLYSDRQAAGDAATAAAAAIAMHLRTAPLLAAQVEIALTAGDITTDRSAAGRLSEIATIYRSRALAAAASAAHGQVAVGEGDAASAVRRAEDALAGCSEVDAPYECASARLVLAAAHRLAGRVDRAALEERTAWTTLDRICARTAVPPRREPLPDRGRCVFRLDGDIRTVVFAGRAVLLHDLKGMHHLARLLAAPDREFHALDLTAGEGGVAARPDGNDAGPVLDGQARAAYKRRLAEIDEDLEEAAALGDAERVALARADRDHLVRELAGAFGLGGRHRVMDSASERARASVTRSLRYSIARIAQHHAQLADHLARSVRTGTYCCYGPDPRMELRWEL